MINPDTAAASLPDYSVRVSLRAKCARLRISPRDGLVVVIPRGFDERRIPELLSARRSWLNRHLGHLQAHRRLTAAADPLPTDIRLTAVGEYWSVDYRASPSAYTGAFEGQGHRLTVRTGVADRVATHAALRRWLSRKAQRHFEPWLQEVSGQTGLAYQRMIVRGQKTRWGSCSRRKTISINYKLLFFPPHLVRYVFLHELCHTRVMNHSPHYWATLAALDPACRAHHAQMREAWRFLPAWLLVG